MKSVVISWASLSIEEKVALVAEMVMGWEPFVEHDTFYWKTPEGLLVYGWDCLHDWNHMRRVVEEMLLKGARMEAYCHNGERLEWSVAFAMGPVDRFAGFGHTLPEAVCLAALRAVGVEVQA